MRAGRALLMLCVLLVALVGVLVLLPYGPSSETLVDIPSGTSTQATAQLLHERGILRDPYSLGLLRVLARGNLRAGEYRFDHPASALEVYRRLRHGDVYTRTLVIPEGFNIFDVAKAVEAAGLGSAAEFLQAERSHTELVRAWSPHASSVEGFLFPATYRFTRHNSALQMIQAMIRQWQRQAEPLILATPSVRYGHGGAAVMLGEQASEAAPQADASPDWNGIVTVASLVEKEVREAEERPTVAGVFQNRLKRGMPLQTDPSVIYAALLEGRYRGTIYASDLQSPSAYNTYRHGGLPPGPVCNPGLASLRAVLHPAQTDYLYFVSDAAGHTRFSTDLKTQTANVQSYRRAVQH